MKFDSQKTIQCLALVFAVTTLLDGAIGQESSAPQIDVTSKDETKVIPRIVAHRGASKDAPENTLPAFRLAWQQGADAIEGDFHMTSDGKTICFHDKDTAALSDDTDGKLVIAESSLERLKSVDVGEHFDESHKGTKMPTLKQVFATVPEGKFFYIEIKCGPEIVTNVLNEIAASDLKQEQIVIISFNQDVIRAVETSEPQFKTCWLTRFKQDETLEVITPSLESVVEDLQSMKCDGVSTHYDLVTKEKIKFVHDKGFEYHAWTVDDIEVAKNLADWGIDSITTNIPGQLRASMAK